MKRICRVVPPFFLTVLLFCSSSAFAQQPTPRLARSIADSARTVLAGSRTPQALRGQDLGPVSPEMAIPGITLVFKRSPEQEDALQDLLTTQQNSASPLYHHWLTPDTFAARFGMADEDITAAETWLQSRGFHIESIARSRDRITFSGTAAQVQSAFGTDLHYYQVDGEKHFAPAADLTLPTELASVTAAVLHLSNFRPKPSIKVQTRPKPDFTSLSTQAHYLVPRDIVTMYDLDTFFQGGAAGSGQSLAVVGQSYVNTSPGSAVSQFTSVVGGGGAITPVLVPGSGPEAILAGDESESELDLEYSSGIATSANIFFVYVGGNQNYDIFDALGFAIDQDIAPVISISYGLCEALMSETDMDQGNSLFQQASAQGQTLVAASGDNGSTACVVFTNSGLTLTQQQALSVLYPASSPYVTAVGGTQMAAGTFTAGSSQYWASATQSDTIGSLLSYVPEVAWNEDSTSLGIAAGGGGASSHFARPTWQTGVPGIPYGSSRMLPDIALQASIESPGFLMCTDDLSFIGAEGQTSSCEDGLVGSNNKYTVAGGTSFAAPIFAGLIAILNQAEHTIGQGNINPILYSLASNPKSYASAFHDITAGSIACVQGVSGCAAPGESGYAAAPGYDEATGLGSVDFNNLVTAWPTTTDTSLTSTAILINVAEFTANPVAANPEDNVPLQIIVDSLSESTVPTAPTGAVSISLDGAVAQSSLAITPENPPNIGASVSYSFVAPNAVGSHLLTVKYLGDATHSPSTGTFSVLVGNVKATGSFTVNASNLTVANGSQGSIPISVTPAAGYSGRVVWSLSAATTNGTDELCYSLGASSTNNLNAATLNIGVGSSCTRVVSGEPTNLRTVTSHTSSKKENSSPWRNTSGLVVCASLIACGSLFTRRRLSLSLWLAIVLITVASLGLSGCGGSSGGSSGGTGNTTPPANPTTYTLTLTGTDSVNTAITASTTFTLTVK
ncbi:protease pro-enzyme activation domain-containing protein [Tunturiibacter lichenicola]|uniref:protease pro-enzyme activation domain-containing protein n=1 Tax=Tunturiibacter lichenicola TaxID=2051959 RepID=UPI0021B2CFD1|nr:protease pro-enzyme activation domain-containing protein [Edaphobacter lichenicola]